MAAPWRLSRGQSRVGTMSGSFGGPNLSQNPFRERSEGGLEGVLERSLNQGGFGVASWSPLGAPLGAFPGHPFGGQNWSPNPSRERSEGGLGGVPERSLSQVGSGSPLGALWGPLLEPSWRISGPSWAPLRPSGASLGPSWGRLGPLLDPPEPLRDPLSVVLGPSWPLMGLWPGRFKRFQAHRKNHRKTIGKP